MPAEFKRAAFNELTDAVPRGSREALRRARTGFQSAPSIGGIRGMFDALGRERQDLIGERQGLLSQGLSASPEEARLARQAAFAPLQGVQGALDEALTFAAGRSQARGFGRSSIGLANQAQASRRILEPLLAQAAGRESQLLLDIPFRNRQFGLQALGAGSQLLGQGAGLAGAQQGLREQSFTELMRATSMASAEREFQSQQRSRGGLRGVGRALGGIAGAGLGAFTGGLGTAAVGGLSSIFGGGGGGGGGGLGNLSTQSLFQLGPTAGGRPGGTGVPTTTNFAGGFQQQPSLQIF